MTTTQAGTMRTTLLVIPFALAAGFVAIQYFADGPMGPLQGGQLRTGAWAEHGNWAFMDDGRSIELQLVSTGESRLTGSVVHQKQLYIPCDLGFIWRRMDGSSRTILHLIYLLKNWHEEALADGRVVLRINGQRYRGHAVRVTDKFLLQALRNKTEQQVEAHFGNLPAIPRDAEAIWYFRIDRRDAA